jgi:hypothetical protein
MNEDEEDQGPEESSDNNSDEGEEAARDNVVDQPANTSAATASDYRRACYLIPLETGELKDSDAFMKILQVGREL